jgi:hypothetical protein
MRRGAAYLSAIGEGATVAATGVAVAGRRVAVGLGVPGVLVGFADVVTGTVVVMASVGIGVIVGTGTVAVGGGRVAVIMTVTTAGATVAAALVGVAGDEVPQPATRERTIRAQTRRNQGF